jgi:predicted PurR-regulated permease PerM
MIRPSPDIVSRPARWTLALVSAALFLFIVHLLRYVLLPFAIAGGLAYVASPAVRWIARRFHLPRWLAALFPFLLFCGALTAAGFAVKILVLPETVSLIANRHTVLEHFFDTLFHEKTISLDGGKTFTAHDASQAILHAIDSIGPQSQRLLDQIGIVAAIVMSFILTLVLLLYFLIDGPRLGRGMMWLVPPTLRPMAQIIGRRSAPLVYRYVCGLIVITIYATVFTWLAMRFVLHLRHAMLLALAVGVLEMVPLIGPILSIVLVCGVAIEQMTLASIIGLALFVTALRISIDQFVGPLILGKAVSLPAPVIIFSFIAGGAIYGILGVLVAIPVAAIVKISLEEIYLRDGE